jgi:hypothetical protein
MTGIGSKNGGNTNEKYKEQAISCIPYGVWHGIAHCHRNMRGNINSILPKPTIPNSDGRRLRFSDTSAMGGCQ